MILISNQILIDFLRLNNRASDIRNEPLGKQLDKIIRELEGTPRNEIACGRDNEEGDPYGFPKVSMSYDFPKEKLSALFENILNAIL